MVYVIHRYCQNEPQLRQNGMGSHYFSIRAIQIYMKEETKKGQSFKFHQNRSMRTPPPMRTFVKLLSRKMTASRWLICCAFVEREKVYAL